LDKAKETAYRKNRNQIQVPGFRRGKAPRKVIEKMYGEGVFLEDALNGLYPEVYPKAVEEAGITPVGAADVDVQNMTAEGFEFICTVPVEPEVTMGQYKGVEAEKADATVTEDDVKAELDRLAQRAASTETVERAAALGDTVVLDFEGFVDGEAFEGGKGEDFNLKLGSGTFIPGFEDQLVGKSAGESCDVSVTFPEEYQAAELAGKPAVFKCTVKSVMETILPEMDDEFAKDVSEFETLDELKKDTEAKIAQSKQSAADRDFEEKVLDKVLEGMEADIPEAMFEGQLDNIMQDYGYRIQQQGITLEDYVKQMGMELSAFRNIFREQAERQVKVQLAMKKIAELEGIEPSEEDINAEYDRLAEAYGLEAEKVRQFVPEESVKSDLTMSKTMEMLKENAVVVAKAAE
ncbi:MAG TPA: trigger factor, partial [Candidatus Butyricicoccus stercorigallinarum]|nr:trigger factor [Candidatus Butyricicoccus stercorigallinarum]